MGWDKLVFWLVVKLVCLGVGNQFSIIIKLLLKHEKTNDDFSPILFNDVSQNCCVLIWFLKSVVLFASYILVVVGACCLTFYANESI